MNDAKGAPRTFRRPKPGEAATDSRLPSDGAAVSNESNRLPATWQPAKSVVPPLSNSMPTGHDEKQKAQSPSTQPGAGPQQSNSSGTPKAKAEILTLEQFLEHAYSLKGRKVTLKSKVEKALSRSPRIDEEARLKLLELAKGDTLLAVPRQLLLVAREAGTYPALRSAIREFVRDVISIHPLFTRAEIAAGLRNLEDAPPPADIFHLLATSDKTLMPVSNSDAMKSSDFEHLCLNATYCMAIWLADMKSLPFTSVVDALFKSVWAPAAQRVDDNSAKLRAVTEIEEISGVGLVVQDYRSIAVDRLNALNVAKSEAQAANEAALSLKDQAEAAQDAKTQAEAQLAAERARHLSELNELENRTNTESAHLRDDFEQLRTRVLRRLKGDLTLLENGLEAIRTSDKLHVIRDHAERVSDSLREEIKKLQGD